MKTLTNQKRTPAYSPPEGGIGWNDSLGSPLIYLAWGTRRYGKTPLPPRKREDWIYVAPKNGSPIVSLNGRRHRLCAGNCLLIAPGCRTEYHDKPSGRCSIQTWVWNETPHFSELSPPYGGYRILRLTDDQSRELSRVHEDCRREVRAPDPRTPFALATLHRRLDLCLIREHPPVRGGARSRATRLQLALDWLKEHPEKHAPTGGLTEYLQISPASLRRIFREGLGHGPREAALRLRLKEARRLIEEEKWSVKEVAHQLGYRHPNDLSRAMGSRPEII